MALNVVMLDERFTKAFQILIGVVLAAMLLAGLYALLGDTVLPLLAEKVKSMFNYTH